MIHRKTLNSLAWWLAMAAPLMFQMTYCMDHQRRHLGEVTNEEQQKHPRVELSVKNGQMTLSNGIVKVTLSAPEGLVLRISYNGVENLLADQKEADDRGYWDMNYKMTGSQRSTIKLNASRYKIISRTENQAEISFVKTWKFGDHHAPIHVDKRFVMLRGSSGLYTYSTIERLKGWPGVNIDELRIVFKLQGSLFNYMAMSDERQRIMPTEEDRETGQVLDYPEAVLLKNPMNSNLRGEVDDKYQHSCENKDNKVHGWVTKDSRTGFWFITPSNEFRNGGPLKQDLTSHTGPILLSMFVSRHYAGEDLAMNFKDGEAWRKVFGPVFVYLNSHASTKNHPSTLWADAKRRMLKEVASWPYTFPHSKDFAKRHQRGGVRGHLLVHDWHVDRKPVPAANAHIGLALPGHAGSWQRESKGYQFWTQADSKGNFVIKHVISGTYNLYAWVPGRIGDYKYHSEVIIRPGSHINLNTLVYKPPRNGSTLWEIGVPDRTAAEFYIPDPGRNVKIHKYTHYRIEKFRQYGLWERYSELYPHSDLVYTVGKSDYRKDWFFAHVTRRTRNGTQKGTTWKILFDLHSVKKSAKYTLHIALASATSATLQVRFNDAKAKHPHFTTPRIGGDNAVARHGIHGLYWLYSIRVPGKLLFKGRNAIFLKQAKGSSRFYEVMYDYIRLEGPLRTHH